MKFYDKRGRVEAIKFIITSLLAISEVDSSSAFSQYREDHELEILDLSADFLEITTTTITHKQQRM